MKPASPRGSLTILLYAAIFLVTQVAGLLLSLTLCWVLRDFTWGFIRVALVNSLLLGLALVGASHFTQRLQFRIKTPYLIEIRAARGDGRNVVTVADSARLLTPSMVGGGQGLTITKKRVEYAGGTFLIRDGAIELSFSP